MPNPFPVPSGAELEVERGEGEPFGTGYSSETTPSGRGASREYPSRGASSARVRVVSFGWEEQGDEKLFVARVALSEPPNWPFDVVWKAWPAWLTVQAPAQGMEAGTGETEGLAAKPNSPVGLQSDAPSSSPALPADITAAINRTVLAAGDHHRAANPFGPEFAAYETARDALEAAILSRLTAAEAQRSDAVARAERMEKALVPFAEAADNLDALAAQESFKPGDYKVVVTYAALVDARAALAAERKE